MKAQKTHQHQMLERVFDFGLNHLDLFPGGSVAKDVIDMIGLLVKKLNGHASSHVAGTGQLKTTTISRNEARKVLKYKLDLIEQTARVLKLDQFYLPRPKTDAAWIAAGQAFAQHAAPLKKDFIKQGLPADFIESLIAAVADLQSASLKQNSTKGAKSSSAAEYDETLKQAMNELKRLDALVKNTLADNPGVMAAWKVARKVGRAPSSHLMAAAATATGAPAGSTTPSQA